MQLKMLIKSKVERLYGITAYEKGLNTFISMNVVEKVKQ